MRSVIVMVALTSPSCGDDLRYGCPVVISPQGARGRSVPVAENCEGAMRYAAKHSATLTPIQEMIDRYFERWVRAIEAEPAIHGGTPQRYRGNPSDITTTNQTVIAVLTPIANRPAYAPGDRNIIATGDATFDDIITELEVPEIESAGIEASTGASVFGISTGAIFNQELLHTRLLATSSHLPDPFVAHKQDGTWTWEQLGDGPGADDDTAIIDATIGWIDCFVDCGGLHTFRAIVPPTGSATVYDVGGDPIPPFITLSPNTLPLP